MVLIKKTIFYVQEEGIGKTIVRITKWVEAKLKHFTARFKEFLFSERYVLQIARHAEGKDLYLLTYSFDWNTPLFQRPHQLAIALSQQKNAYVIFASDQYRFDNFAGLITINPGLDVVPLRFLLRHPKSLFGAKSITIFKSLPTQMKLLERVKYNKLVYDYIDDLAVIPCLSTEMRNVQHKLMINANLTVCTAKALYRDALRYTSRAILLPNACDYSFFHQGRNCSPNEAISMKTSKYRCVLGYYGCLAKWFDYELIMQIAKERPDWCFLLIGQCFDGSDRCLLEAGIENLILWPAQPYRELPRFISAFDIQIIPFKINQITAGTSPVKLFEYMATGKPILTSAMPECEQYKSVEIYHTVEEFIEKAENLRRLPPDDEYFEYMDLEARENTWEARVKEILEKI